MQWTRAVTRFFADHFEQFHGQKVVTACADALNSAFNAGHAARYFLLSLSGRWAAAAHK